MTLTPTTSSIDVARWHEPEGLNPRGTVFILTGRGETPEIYQRFGSRLAADAYRVVAISAGDHTAEEVRAELAELISAPDHPAPLVLVGSDAGARSALELVADGTVRVDAVITAGLPTGGTHAPVDWQAEIATRTACPTHQGVLRRSARGSLFQEVDAFRLRSEVPKIAVSVLALHGSEDQISPLDEALAAYAAAGVSDVRVIDGGLHDILNDVTHRSVAATIVLFLEQLRVGIDKPLIVAPARKR